MRFKLLRNWRRVTVTLLVLAGGLHAYESFVLIDGPPSLGWFAWGWAPYSWCLLALLSVNGLPAAAGSASGLVMDLLGHYAVFINPTSSTAALVLLFIPVWNTLLFIPLPILLVRWILARKKK